MRVLIPVIIGLLVVGCGKGESDLIFSAPRGVAKDKLCQRPVSLIDIYPTLIDLCGLPKRRGLDGQSLKSLLGNPERKWERPAVITYGLNNHAVQTER